MPREWLCADPCVQKSMDPEMVQEFKENQAKLSNFQTSLQNGDLKSRCAFRATHGVSCWTLSSYSALMSGEEPRTVVATAAAKQPNSASNTPKNRGNKKRRWRFQDRLLRVCSRQSFCFVLCGWINLLRHYLCSPSRHDFIIILTREFTVLKHT